MQTFDRPQNGTLASGISFPLSRKPGVRPATSMQFLTLTDPHHIHIASPHPLKVAMEYWVACLKCMGSYSVYNVSAHEARCDVRASRSCYRGHHRAHRGSWDRAHHPPSRQRVPGRTSLYSPPRLPAAAAQSACVCLHLPRSRARGADGPPYFSRRRPTKVCSP
jgi:hypothetical protein